MIQSLISDIVSQLQDALTGSFPNPTNRIVEGPDTPNQSAVPFISVYQDALFVEEKGRDVVSSEPRPVDVKEEITLNPGQILGPYNLAQLPVKGSVLGQLVLDLDTVDERTQLLVEGVDKDFVITMPLIQGDPATISFDAEITDRLSMADAFRLSYSYIGIYAIREFSQEFVLDVYETELADAEQWAAISTSIILTHQDEFLANFNNTGHSIGDYSTRHILSQLNWKGSEINTTGNPLFIRLRYHVLGQLICIRSITDGYSFIEKIRSPGKQTSASVDIDVNLG